MQSEIANSTSIACNPLERADEVYIKTVEHYAMKARARQVHNGRAGFPMPYKSGSVSFIPPLFIEFIKKLLRQNIHN